MLQAVLDVGGVGDVEMQTLNAFAPDASCTVPVIVTGCFVGEAVGVGVALAGGSVRTGVGVGVRTGVGATVWVGVGEGVVDHQGMAREHGVDVAVTAHPAASTTTTAIQSWATSGCVVAAKEIAAPTSFPISSTLAISRNNHAARLAGRAM